MPYGKCKLDETCVYCYNCNGFNTWVPTPLFHASPKRPRAFQVGLFVRLGQVGGIVDYSKTNKAELIEEIAALQEKIAGPERAQAERLSAEQSSKRAEEMHS